PASHAHSSHANGLKPAACTQTNAGATAFNRTSKAITERDHDRSHRRRVGIQRIRNSKLDQGRLYSRRNPGYTQAKAKGKTNKEGMHSGKEDFERNSTFSKQVC